MKQQLPRRSFLTKLSASIATALATPLLSFSKRIENTTQNQSANKPILTIQPMGFQWETIDPFLFCVHH